MVGVLRCGVRRIQHVLAGTVLEGAHGLQHDVYQRRVAPAHLSVHSHRVCTSALAVAQVVVRHRTVLHGGQPAAHKHGEGAKLVQGAIVLQDVADLLALGAAAATHTCTHYVTTHRDCVCRRVCTQCDVEELAGGVLALGLRGQVKLVQIRVHGTLPRGEWLRGG